MAKAARGRGRKAKPVERVRVKGHLWRENPKRKRRFIEMALRHTREPMTRIRKVAGVDGGTVSDINSKADIRSPELVREIWVESTRRTKLARRKKVCAFTDAEKMALIKENGGGIFSKLNIVWFGYGTGKIIKREFGSLKEFAKAAEGYIFEQLDYFDPERKSKRTGRPIKASTWVINGAKIFAMQMVTRIGKRIEITGFPGLESITATSKARMVPFPEKNLKRLLHEIPPAAKHVLRKLGLDLNRVATMGFIEIKETVLRIANEPKTGLTGREKTVIAGRLEGRTTRELEEPLGLSRTTISTIQASAVLKIKARLARLKALQ